MNPMTQEEFEQWVKDVASKGNPNKALAAIILALAKAGYIDRDDMKQAYDYLNEDNKP